MNTWSQPIACAMIRQPSISRCGRASMISRSLKVPGSDSSALTTRYVACAVPLARKLALRPIGKNGAAAAAEVRLDEFVDDRWGSIARAARERLVAADGSYSASCVRSRVVRLRQQERCCAQAFRSSSTIAGTSSARTGSR